MPKGCLVISMVTPNPDTLQVVGKKAAKKKVSCIIRYGSKEICSRGVREDCVILSQNISSKAYEDDLGSCCCSQDINKQSNGSK